MMFRLTSAIAILAVGAGAAIVWASPEDGKSSPAPLRGEFVSGHRIEVDPAGLYMTPTVFLGPVVTNPSEQTQVRVITACVNYKYENTLLTQVNLYRFVDPQSRDSLDASVSVVPSAVSAPAGTQLPADDVYTVSISPALGLVWQDVDGYEDLDVSW